MQNYESFFLPNEESANYSYFCSEIEVFNPFLMNKMMKKFLLPMVALAAVSCVGGNRERALEVTNPTQNERADEAIVLTRAQLNPGSDATIPAVKDAAGNYVASQVDDLNGDGTWDELAFLVDLAAADTARLQIVWVAPADYPQFPVRTNVRYGKMTSPGQIEELTSDIHFKDELYELNVQGYPYQMDGIAWENDKAGYRHYYDGRNNKDFFGKRTPNMVLDTVGIRPNGYPGDTYHVWADWGRDIMSVGTSFGIGGLAAWVGDSTIVKLGRSNLQVPDIIDSTRYTLLTEGPVRSRFALDFYGWEVNGSKIDLRQETTIWAGQYNYENRVIAPSLPGDVSLVTGFLYHFNDMPLEEFPFTNYVGLATHDFQTYNKEFIMGVGLVLPKSGVKKLFTTPEFIPEEVLSRTWCAELQLDSKGEVVYYPLAAWEHGDERFKDREFFLNTVRTLGEKLDNPVQVTLAE
jgi:hypothetical protein